MQHVNCVSHENVGSHKASFTTNNNIVHLKDNETKKGALSVNKNSMFPLNKNTAKKPNRMWVPILTTVGLSAAMYGLRKYKNGKLMTPIQNFMKKFQNTGIQNVLAGATNPVTEFSQELTNMKAYSGSQQNTAQQNTSANQQKMQENTTANMSSQQNTTDRANNQNKTQ